MKLPVALDLMLQLGQQLMQGRIMPVLNHNLIVILIFNARNRPGRRAQNHALRRQMPLQTPGQLMNNFGRRFFFGVGHHQAHRVKIRRVLCLFPQLHFRAKKGLIIARLGQLDHVIIGIVSLDQDLSRFVRPAGPATNLSEEVKGPVSAFSTPTKVTLGKSSPLAIICVPSKISAWC